MGRFEEIKERYKGPMMNEDIRWCTGKIERLNKIFKDIRGQIGYYYVESFNENMSTEIAIEIINQIDNICQQALKEKK